MSKSDDQFVDQKDDVSQTVLPAYVFSAENLGASRSSEIDLVTLVQIVWSRRYLIAGVVTIFMAIASAIAFLSTEWYRSDALLAPSDSQTSRAGSSSGLGSIGGLAGLAGLSIEDSGGAEAVAILESRDFARSFIVKNNLMQVLFADEWDSEAGNWRSDNPAEQPDIRDAIKIFDEDVRTVSKNAENGLVTLSVVWTDASIAATWVSDIVRQLNEQMRAQALADTQTNIAFLEEQLESTNVAMLRQSVANILESELEKLMLAKGELEYAFRILDSPQIAKRPYRPKRLLIVLGAMMLGGVLALFYVLFEYMLRRTIPDEDMA
jgi:uncharacterized protein involved in exopolysaccharide biosynthesis